MPNQNLGNNMTGSYGNQDNNAIVCDNKGFLKTKVNSLRFNNNYAAPFFAYGLFKPGQLAYSRIEEYVDIVKTYGKPRIIPYKMITRDGVPLIEDKANNGYSARGFLIYFKKGSEKQAYDTISGIQGDALYDWKEIEVDGIKSNVLVGLHLDRGIPEDEDDLYDFKGEKDPLFTHTIKKVGRTVKELENDDKIMEDYEKKFSTNIQNFFKIQLDYMLLWAAIERYASLKYDIGRDVKVQFAKEYSDIISKVIKQHVNEERVVYNSDTLWCNKLDPNKPVDSMFYYYTIRCNVVHNGKDFQIWDFDLLKKSLVELYKIFKQVYDETFKMDKRILLKV